MNIVSADVRADIDRLKSKYPLMDVVERAGVRLKRSGANSLQGLCPFHADRNPSFTVNTERQRFRCFGCGVYGDVLDFVQLHEHLPSLAEARSWLAGTPAPPSGMRREPAQSGPGRERRWDRLTLEEQLVMNTAGALYRDALWRFPAARCYLGMRGIPDCAVRSCGLRFRAAGATARSPSIP